MKHIPNIITSARLIAAILLLATTLWNRDHGLAWFIPLFVIGGISDLFDGYTARKFGCCTEFGARLDSISDLSIYSAAACFLWVHTKTALAENSLLLAAAIFMQIFHIAFALVKHRAYPSYHTDFSRLIAYFQFFGVLTFWFLKAPVVISILICAWIATIVEGIIITSVLSRTASDLAGLAAAIETNSRIRAEANFAQKTHLAKANQISPGRGALDRPQTH